MSYSGVPLISIVISYLLVKLYGISYLLILPLFALAFFLFFLTIKDFFSKESSLSQKVSHNLKFGLIKPQLSIKHPGALFPRIEND